MKAHQVAVTPNPQIYADLQAGKEGELVVLVYPEWELSFGPGQVIDVQLGSNDLFDLGVRCKIIKSSRAVTDHPRDVPYLLKLKVKKILPVA